MNSNDLTDVAKLEQVVVRLIRKETLVIIVKVDLLNGHKLVVADVVEPILIGLDFMRSHRATWDWLTGDLVFQEADSDLPENTCRLVREEEVPPRGTTSCFRVEIFGSPPCSA